MNGELYKEILKDELMNSLDWYGHNVENIIFQQDNDPKHTCKRVQKWFDTHRLRFYSGQLSPQTLIPLNIFGFISRKGLETIKSQQKKKKSFGRELRWNGKRFLKKSVKN